ncbi:GPW/gp25 family protein [Pseudomonas sp. UYIF39]|uniref:GPW/gp25 family protein n=1 Tax=Pseudomonas sp. UYIF39 TaxID=1630747 RepID=UPI00249E68BE|nr:GPW/gp25 family protein [Pseudomonas sp. UYIF39]MDI3355697.1 GPW/gp25 family protein [Pseudomonas sp. UYIF39]
MNNHTGLAISGNAHLAQSIADILTTPLGSRIMRREYGSLLPNLIDAPFNPETRMLCYAATATALIRWEPRLRLSRVQFSDMTVQGNVVIDIEGTRVDTNEPLNLQVPLKLGATA